MVLGVESDERQVWEDGVADCAQEDHKDGSCKVDERRACQF